MLFKRFWGGGGNLSAASPADETHQNAHDSHLTWKQASFDSPITARVQSAYIDGLKGILI